MINTVMEQELNNFREQLNELSFADRQLLRRIAVYRLREFSVEEIGSSDVTNELFSMWKNYSKSFRAILDEQYI
jgi:hypothetical protein